MAINRRAFLKSIAVGLVGAALDTRIDQILQDTTNLTDGDFISYVTTSMNLWILNPAKCAVIENIAVPTDTETKLIDKISIIGFDKMKHHFHCINCKITFHLNFMPRNCIWCGIPARDPLPNFIDVEQMKGLAKQIHDVQRTISKI